MESFAVASEQLPFSVTIRINTRYPGIGSMNEPPDGYTPTSGQHGTVSAAEKINTVNFYMHAIINIVINSVRKYLASVAFL